MSLDISGDWVVFDNSQSIQYYSRSSDGTFAAPITVTALKREDHKKHLEATSVEVAQHLVIWEIFRATMSTQKIPKRGDKLVATTISGVTTWIVDSADYSDFTTRYRTMCYQVGQGS